MANMDRVDSVKANWELNPRECSGLGGCKVLQSDGLIIKINNMAKTGSEGETSKMGAEWHAPLELVKGWPNWKENPQ